MSDSADPNSAQDVSVSGSSVVRTSDWCMEGHGFNWFNSVYLNGLSEIV